MSAMRWLLFRPRRPPELVLFVIWPSGRAHEARLRAAIERRFELLLDEQIDWPANGARQRLSTLYGRDVAALFAKNVEVGVGSALMLLTLDRRVKTVWSRRANAQVNAAAYRIKHRERRHMKRNHLHASDSESDAIDFATKLLNCSREFLVGLKTRVCEPLDAAA